MRAAVGGGCRATAGPIPLVGSVSKLAPPGHAAAAALRGGAGAMGKQSDECDAER